MIMENFKSLEKVKSFTQKLNWEESQMDELNSLARYFLYGGYIRVLDRYRIYIKCVEFYFHSERENGIKDPIVYHRNNYHVDGELPYFIPFTIHAHASGFDIAFENPKEKYRASVLIRAYEVYDDAKEYEDKPFLNVNNGKFNHSCNSLVNKQSTYLYDILNGFGDAGDISWFHKLSEQYKTDTCSMELPTIRQNVPLYIKNAENEFEIVTEDYYNVYRDKVEFKDQLKDDPFNKIQISEPHFFTYNKRRCLKDLKPWSFSRKESITNII